MKALQTMSSSSLLTLRAMLLVALLSRAVAKNTTTDNRIIGGTEVPAGKYPYFARFDPPRDIDGTTKKKNICGAVLVSPYVAITGKSISSRYSCWIENLHDLCICCIWRSYHNYGPQSIFLVCSCTLRYFYQQYLQGNSPKNCSRRNHFR